jgi:hypothetical protein
MSFIICRAYLEQQLTCGKDSFLILSTSFSAGSSFDLNTNEITQKITMESGLGWSLVPLV